MSLVFFDLDGTIINGQSQEYLIFFLRKKRYINFFPFFLIITWFIGYKAKIFKDPEWIFRYSISVLAKNRSKDEIDEILKSFFSQELIKFFNLDIIDKLNKHLESKNRVIIVSNCIKPLVEIVADYLNVNEVIATELEIKDNIYTGRIKSRIVYGKRKVDLVRKIFPESEVEQAFAYADHYSDFDLLKAVKYPILVNPSEKTLEFYKNNYKNNNLEIIKK